MIGKKSVLTSTLAIVIAGFPIAGCTTQGANSSISASSESFPQTSALASDPSADVEFVIHLGTNDKDTNQPVFSHEESKERVKAILMKEFGGYTIQEAEGGWKSENGTEYQEYTLVIYLSNTNIDAVHAVAKELMDEFRQESVLITTDHVQTEFYESE